MKTRVILNYLHTHTQKLQPLTILHSHVVSSYLVKTYCPTFSQNLADTITNGGEFAGKT